MRIANRTLQAWEAGRSAPNRFAVVALIRFLTSTPLSPSNVIRADQGQRDSMPKPGAYRSPWRDFPDVVIQTTVHKLRSRPAYDQAKRGVGEAAFKVVQELTKPEKIPFAFDIIVPVMQFDRDKPNALPLAYATALAKQRRAALNGKIAKQ